MRLRTESINYEFVVEKEGGKEERKEGRSRKDIPVSKSSLNFFPMLEN